MRTPGCQGRQDEPWWGEGVPKWGWAPARPGIKVKAENKPAGIRARPQRPASLSLKALGNRGAEGGSGGGGSRTPHAWVRLSLSFSQPKGLQGCC